MAIPVTDGQGQSSVATEQIGTVKYQQIKVVGGETGSASVMGVNPDRSISVSVIGIPTVSLSGSPSISGAVTIAGSVLLGSSDASVITRWADSSVIAVPVGSVITVWQNSSIIAINSGSVVAISQGSVITVWKDSSVLAVPVGSTIAVLQSSSILAVPVGSVITVWQTPSIVGTYAEDAASASADKGIFVLGVRNDTLSSVTSADGDYSPLIVGPTGEVVTANAPITKWVRGTADLRVVLGASVTAIPAQGASIFTYVTGVQVVNMGSASVIVTLAGGLGSILGYTIAPAGGGSNIYYPNALKTGENSAFTASISGTASVLVSAQGFIAKI